ncbi:hypothetical protein [Sorangium sp. So ce1182]|uniref:hypothetical protein n=1 Tax=Sorangium sp. So ce1182 TaxID=3133334 RepID=UPI003F6294C3
MENSRRGTRLAALAALAWGSACGGNVVVDGMPDGSGGAGATGTSGVGVGVTSTSASWTTTSAVTSSSTGVGGGEAWSLCMSYCELLQESCRPESPADCSGHCDWQLAKAPECISLLVPFYECAMSGAGRCEPFPFICYSDVDRYTMCAYGPGSGSDCGSFTCSDIGDRTCHCKGSCSGVDFAAECRSIGPSRVICSCSVDGTEVSVCEDVGWACDRAGGCCGPIFEELR